ncbi:unnamed protein product [Effrenium voratum]|nr:unnamed protein product [Effrenium voratum]
MRLKFIATCLLWLHAHAVRPSLSVRRLNGTLAQDEEVILDARAPNESETCEQCQGVLMNYLTVLQTTTRPRVTGAALILAATFLTWLMVDTAQLFFLPALLYWSRRMHLSPEMAAATLLALGNGAPDAADAVAAAQLQDLPLGLSDLTGSNLCSDAGQRLQCAWGQRFHHILSTHARGQGHYQVLLVFYCAAIVLLIFGLRKAVVNFWVGCALPALYAVYVLWLAFVNAEENDNISRARRRSSVTDVAMENALACLSPPTESTEMLPWLLMLPFTVLRLACIPPCDLRWDMSRRFLHAVCPIGNYVVCLMAGYLDLPSVKEGVAIGAVLVLLSVSIFAFGAKPTVYKGALEHLPWFYTLMAIVALVSSIMWLGMLSSEITSLLEGVFRHFEMNRLRSGFTLLAWGNCAGDLVASYSLAVMGKYSLALNGLVASQFFNMAVGFGTSLILVTAEDKELTVFAHGWPLAVRDPLLACAVALAMTVATLAVFSIRDVHVQSPMWAIVLGTIYMVFLIYMWVNTRVDAPLQIGAD